MTARRRAARARRDAVVVGAGHNGLVAAAYLARAGLRTVVCERRQIVGGACTTEEFAPGFRASPGAYVLSLLRPAIWRDFGLRRRGLEVLEAAPTLNVFRDGALLTLHDDPAETAAELARFDPRDAGAFAAFAPRCSRSGSCSDPGSTVPPPAPRLARRGGRCARCGQRRGRARAPRPRRRTAVRDLGPRLPRRALSLRVHAGRARLGLDLEHARRAVDAGDRVLPASRARGERARRPSWGFVRGGMGEVTRLIAEPAPNRARDPHRRRRPRRSWSTPAAPPASASPATSESRAPPCSRTPTRSARCSGCVDPAALTAEIAGGLQAYRCEGASMKINLAVGELPRIAGTPGRAQEHHRA